MVTRAAILVAALLAGSAALAQDTPPLARPAGERLSPAEQAFAEQMSGATLVGGFTVTGAADAAVRPERYDIGGVRLVGKGQWLIPARIKYGDHDVTLPITLPVQFAGDTAVIRVDKVGFPGLGEYSARVLIHDGRYAGYWRGAGRGGHLFGVIEKRPEKPGNEPSPTAQP